MRKGKEKIVNSKKEFLLSDHCTSTYSSAAKALLRCISVDSVADKKTFSSLDILVPRQETSLSRVSCEEPQSFESKCYLPVGFSKKSFESTAFL
ncbi:hypothetical protein CEXT_298341 [Caerostris extrusa]|uniref:Uncharacterized protein n=1 Tax=Caerostris extrusa TaxID=172846 RepID=A0AAV4M6N8_CAEEX|nr:hypothetical protein CEXT_298341 [Caerostris extrusa]